MASKTIIHRRIWICKLTAVGSFFKSFMTFLAGLRAAQIVIGILITPGQGVALDGIEMLKQVVQNSKGKIEIVVGGGINPENVNQILRNLPLLGNKISVHSYSGVQEYGFTNPQLIKTLISRVNSFDSEN